MQLVNCTRITESNENSEMNGDHIKDLKKMNATKLFNVWDLQLVQINNWLFLSHSVFQYRYLSVCLNKKTRQNTQISFYNNQLY